MKSGGQVHRFLLEDLTLPGPLWACVEAFADLSYVFLLDSAGGPAQLARYSFLGADPFLVYRAWHIPGSEPGRDARVEVERRIAPAGPRRETFEGVDLWRHLRSFISAYEVENDGTELPFLGGAVGYWGYEVGHFIERLPDRARDDLGLPDICLLFVDWVVIHDHHQQRSWLAVNAWDPSPAPADAKLEARRQWIRSRLRRVRQVTVEERASVAVAKLDALPVEAQDDGPGYRAKVEDIRRRIAAGDAFEVCLTQRLKSPATADAWSLYRRLRESNPAPFAAYLALPEATLLSSSPERFLRLDRDRVAESRPIKGTRRRGATAEEDEALRLDLVRSPKDRAENLMIVDLVRNDLGRVCRFHSVEVPQLMEVEAYATVFQLVSTVRGRLRPDCDALHLIRASFPGGSMTGAPKIAAMKIIDRLEPTRRGPYSGALGYLDFRGTLDLSIVIRTLLIVGGEAHYGSGGAVVYDSDPESEYQEMLDKAVALQRVLASFLA